MARFGGSLSVGGQSMEAKAIPESPDPGFGLALRIRHPSIWPKNSQPPGFGKLALAERRLSKAVASNLGLALALSVRGMLRKQAALFERIRAEGGDVSLLVAFSPVDVGSFSLSPELSRAF